MAGSDAAQKEAVQADFDFLTGVKADPISGCHTNTKFHCLGHPFQSKDYKEPDWAARLYYSIRDKLANNVKVYLSYRYMYNFSELQQIYSLSSSVQFYCFRAVPDLIFTRSAITAGGGALRELSL